MALWLQVLVQLPLALTGHMIYVDIGWPLGLVLMALQGTHAAAPAYSARHVALRPAPALPSTHEDGGNKDCPPHH